MTRKQAINGARNATSLTGQVHYAVRSMGGYGVANDEQLKRLDEPKIVEICEPGKAQKPAKPVSNPLIGERLKMALRMGA
jgi:hypothetical protein